MSESRQNALSQMNADMKRTALALVASQVRWDLVRFFKANPFTIHTSQGLARIIGRRREKVEAETIALVREAVLRQLPQDGDLPAIFAYEPDPDVRLVIEMIENICNGHPDLIEDLRQRLIDEEAQKRRSTDPSVPV